MQFTAIPVSLWLFRFHWRANHQSQEMEFGSVTYSFLLSQLTLKKYSLHIRKQIFLWAFSFFFRQYQLFTHKAAFFFWRQSDGKPTENYILSLSCLAFQCDTLYLIYLNKDRYRRETNPCDERVELFAKTDPLNLLSLRA